MNPHVRREHRVQRVAKIMRRSAGMLVGRGTIRVEASPLSARG